MILEEDALSVNKTRGPMLDVAYEYCKATGWSDEATREYRDVLEMAEASGSYRQMPAEKSRNHELPATHCQQDYHPFWS